MNYSPDQSYKGVMALGLKQVAKPLNDSFGSANIDEDIVLDVSYPEEIHAEDLFQ